MWRRWLLGGLVVIAVLLAVVLGRTFALTSKQTSPPPIAPRAVDTDGAAKRLAEAVRLRTVTHQDRDQDDRGAFEALHALLRESYPRTHAALGREVLDDLSLLYTWPGSDPGLAPLVLVAHQDVVPIADREAWSRDPFAGTIEEGMVWGRGTLDDKGSLLGILEGVEALLADGFAPKRTVLLAFGSDEEVRGKGAEAIVALLEQRKLTPYLVLDEGSIIADGLVPGIAGKVALVGIAEKGYATMDLVVKAEGGHSSMPPRSTAAGRLATAVTRLETTPLPPAIAGPVAAQLDYLAPHMSFGLRMAMANRWLFGGAVESAFERTKSGSAQLRTTTAVTMLQGSPKENVLPSEARATVNFRIRPGDTVASVKSHVEQLVGPGVEVVVHPGANDPPPVSPIEGAPFATLQQTIGEVFPSTIVAPSLVVATTDARAYARVATHVYRFLPVPFTKEDLPRLHGVDERITVDAHVGAIRFYARLIENAAGS
ncbi:MAG: M20 family peptidase [Polyangiaceae bacterium]